MVWLSMARPLVLLFRMHLFNVEAAMGGTATIRDLVWPNTWAVVTFLWLFFFGSW
jgi:hypothetical protein